MWEAMLKYLDIFGITCTFYSEKMSKLYTVAGGVYSILSLLSSTLILILFCLDDLKRKSPNTSVTSIPNYGFKTIKFGKEKIWIPWSIVDYKNNEFINHTGLLFPIIYHYSGKKDEETKEFNLTRKTLNYKLCNETSMANEKYSYEIRVSLNKIYCIDMEDLEVGGSWMGNYISYIQFDLYYCQNGIKYNASSSQCTSFNTLKNYLGENNSLEIDFYYPIAQFQPSNKTNPIVIFYQQRFYHLSKYVNKIERVFLQEHILTDDSGWIFQNEVNTSYWGINSINGESYYNGEDNDLYSEGSNSRAYSFNLYIEPGVIHYRRSYKRIYSIFGDYYPIAYFIFMVLKSISIFFKKVENNKKMIEILFENLKEKPNEFEENIKRLKTKRMSQNRRTSFNKNLKELNFLKKKKLSIDIHHKFGKSSSISNNSFINNINNINIFPGKQKRKSLGLNSSKHNLIFLEHYNHPNNISEKKKNNESKKSILNIQKEKKLFPYKYYFFSFFIKNLNLSTKSYFFSERFTKIYIFFCHLFDITTYLLLQREFNALKSIFKEKDIDLFEKNNKIYYNHSFIKEICEGIEDNKYNIFE